MSAASDLQFGGTQRAEHAPSDFAPLCVDAAGLATMLDLSLRTVRRLDDAGKLPDPICLGGSKRWLVEEIHAWLRAGAPPRRQWRSPS